MEQIRVLVSGAYGRMGREVVKAVLGAKDMVLVGAVDKEGVGQDAGRIAGVEDLGVMIAPDLREAIEETKPQVVVDFSTPLVVMGNIRIIIGAGVAGVIGTTGITEDNLKEITALIGEKESALLLAPNFAIGAVLMMRFAEEAAKYLPHAEIIELHHDRKMDAPSGTALKTAEMIAAQRRGETPAEVSVLEKLKGTRGAELAGVRIHSVRLPGLVAHQEVIFGGPGQTLRIRHDSLDRSSFMPGVLLGIRRVMQVKGFFYGLETFLD